MANEKNDQFGDERLKRNSAADIRGPRESADVDRVHNDGNSLNAEERRRLLRQEWVQEVLPTPPKIPGYHCCWLSTTNSTDPVYKRIQRGYVPVKATEVPGFGSQFTATGGDFDGCVACNEMLLFKVPEQVYQDLMAIYHYDMPLEQEATIRENVERKQEYDSSGRKLGSVEGDFGNLGKSSAQPTSFIS
jgi:hypothetical protein